MSDNFLVGVEFQFKLKSNEAKKCEEFDDMRARTIYIQYKRPTTLTIQTIVETGQNVRTKLHTMNCRVDWNAFVYH